MSSRFELPLRMLRACQSKPGATLAAIVVLLGLSAYLVSNLGLVTSYVAMIPEDTPEVRDATRGAEELESTQELVIAVSGAEADKKEDFARQVTPRLRELPGVAAADYEFPLEFFEKKWLLLLDEDDQRRAVDEILDELRAERRQRNPLYADLGSDDETPSLRERLHGLVPDGDTALQTTEDGEYLLITVEPRIDVDTPIEIFDEIVTSVEHVLATASDAPDVDYRLSGHMILALEEYESLRGDLGRATGLALVLVLILLSAATRRPVIVLSCGISLAVGMALTLGVTELTLGRLNVVSAFMLPALLGLGVDFGIHLHNAYDVHLRSAPPREAMANAVDELFPPCLVAACTTAAGFAALLICDFDGIREYGIIAGVGILLMLAATFVIAPIITPRLWQEPTQLGGKDESFRTGPVFFVALGIGLLLFASAGLGSTSFENDFRHLRGELPTASFHEYLMDDAGRPFDPTLLIVESETDAEAIAKIARQERFSESGRSTDIGTVIALSDFLPSSSPESEALRQLRQMLARFDDSEPALEGLRTATSADTWGRDAIPEPIHRRLITRSGHPVIAVYSRDELGSDVEFALWQEHLQAIIEEARQQEIGLTVVDKWAVVHRMLSLIRDAFAPMVGLALFLVILTSAFLLRDWRRCLLVVAAVSAGAVALAGALGWMNTPLNLFSIVVLPSIFGIGVDNAVQLIDGFDRHEFSRVMATRWRACLISTATTACGFGALIIASHRGVASLGLTALTGLALMFVATSVVLPAIVALLRTNSVES